MAKIVTDSVHYENIANAIRDTGYYSPHSKFLPKDMATGIHRAAEYSRNDYWDRGVRKSFKQSNIRYYNSIAEVNYSESTTQGGGKVCTFTGDDGLKHYVLLDHCSVDKVEYFANAAIHLNGYTMTVAENANLHLSNKVIIDGTVNGSRIVKEITQASGDVNATNGTLAVTTENSTLHINGGAYVIRLTNTETAKRIYGCFMTSGEFTAENCEMYAQNLSPVSDFSCVLRNISKDKVVLRNCKITLETVACSTNIALQLVSTDVTVENCEIKATALKEYVEVIGIYAYCMDGNQNVAGVVRLKNCNVEATGSSDSENSIYLAQAFRSTNSKLTTIIEGGSYFGTREALQTSGKVLINGGTFEGCQHGGAYFGGEIRAQNATFRNAQNRGIVPFSHFRGGVVYTMKDTALYMNRCSVEASASGAINGVVCNNRYDNIVVYLSNIHFDGPLTHDLRVDYARVIYLGVNVPYTKVNYGVNHQPDTCLEQGVLDEKTYAGVNFIWDEEGNLLDYYRDGKNAGRRVETGTFTPAEDVNRIQLQIAPGAKLLEVTAKGTLSAASANRMPVTHITATEIQERNGTKGGAYTEYITPSEKNPVAATPHTFDNSAGVTIDFGDSSVLCCEAGVPYEWMACWWDD